MMGMGKRTRNIFLLWIATSVALVMYYEHFKDSVPHRQFYPSMVRVSKNAQAMILATVHWFSFAYLFTKFLIKIFLGELRAIELENVQGNFWIAVTDIALTFMIFSSQMEASPVSSIILSSCLIGVQTLHWLYSDRVNFMETSPVITWKYRLRMIGLTVFLLTLDINLAYYSYEMYIKKKTFFLVFLCNYSLLSMRALHTFIQFCLHSIDLASSSPWENKSLYMMYIKVIIGSCRIGINAVFLYLLQTVNTFPLYQLRPIIMEIKVMKNTIKDIINSRKAIKKMESFPNATVDDFKEDTDTTCIICHEEMCQITEVPIDENEAAAGNSTNNSEPASSGDSADKKPKTKKVKKLLGKIKKLPCGHMFFEGPLRSWFLRQQTCPICRANVLVETGPRTYNHGIDIPWGNELPERQARRVQRMMQNYRNNPPPGGFDPDMAEFLGIGRNRNGNAANNNNNNNSASSNNNTPAANTNGNAIPNRNIDNIANEMTVDALKNLLNKSKTSNNFQLSNEKIAEIMKLANKTVPLPKVPANLPELMKLNSQELREMESNSKKAIVQRIEFLRNIRTMCDASICMMGQYEDLMIKEMPEISSVLKSTSKSDDTKSSSSSKTQAATDSKSTSSSKPDLKNLSKAEMHDFLKNVDIDLLTKEIGRRVENKLKNLKEQTDQVLDEDLDDDEICIDEETEKMLKTKKDNLEKMIGDAEKRLKNSVAAVTEPVAVKKEVPSLNSGTQVKQEAEIQTEAEGQKDAEPESEEENALEETAELSPNELRRRRLAALERRI